MAEVEIFKFQDYKFSAREEDRIIVFYDDVADKFVVRRAQGSRSRIITENPNFDPYPNAPHVGQLSAHEFCKGLDRVRFRGTDTCPYAVQEVEVGAAVCVPAGGCNLSIAAIGVTNETLPGAEDGAAVVTAASTYGGLEYSLDNATWQSSNTFAGLAAVDYTAYVRDVKGCNASQAFTIAPGGPESHGLRYFLDYDDYQGKLYGLRIAKKFYTGVPEQVEASGEPMRIRYLFDGGDRFAPLIGSELTVELLCSVNEQFAELFTSDERDYRVELWDNEADLLLWRGYVLPDVYNEPFISPGKVVTIVATDGVGTLKDRPFLDAKGRPYAGRRTLLQIILLCLRPLDMILPVYESVNWFESSMDTTGDVSPLVQLDQDVGEFYDTAKGEAADCGSVLAATLSNLKAQLLQSEGAWVIHQPNFIYREPVVVYPPVSFELFNPRLTVHDALIRGEVNLVSVSGGNPADGPYEWSLDGQTWLSLLTLELTQAAGYLLSGLAIGGTGQVFLRRQGRPEQTASRSYTIPDIASGSLTVRAAYSPDTTRATAVITRNEADFPLVINYRTYRLTDDGQDNGAVADGTISMGVGVKARTTILDGRYLPNSAGATQRFEFRITATSLPMTYTTRTPIVQLAAR